MVWDRAEKDSGWLALRAGESEGLLLGEEGVEGENIFLGLGWFCWGNSGDSVIPGGGGVSVSSCHPYLCQHVCGCGSVRLSGVATSAAVFGNGRLCGHRQSQLCLR